ncbi:MAG: glycosyltransferase family A protein [Nanoarchaeota archaeon]
MDNYPGILVGILTCDLYNYCADELEQTIKTFSYPNYDILFIDNSETYEFFNKLKEKGFNVIKTKRLQKWRDILLEGHNILIDKALEGNYDFLFLLDADTIPPKDVLERLVKHNKKVVSGLYFNYFTINGVRDYYPIIRIEIPGEKEKWTVPNQDIWGTKELIKIVCAGTGCLLLHKDIIKKYKFWYEKESKGADDIFFFKSLLNDNVGAWCDTSIICKHLLKNKLVFAKDFYKSGEY